jgi:lysophospholipase L1-like esterase
MADILLDIGNGLKKRFRDMGDGTHAEVVVIPSAGGPRGNRLVPFGDSITALASVGNQNVACTAVGNVVTANYPDHALTVGQPVIMHLSSPDVPAYHGVWPVSSVIDRNNFTVVVKDAPSGPATLKTGLLRAFGSNAWWAWANGLLGAPFNIVANAGIGSNTTDMMLARIETDVIAYRPDWVTVLGGTNDIRYAKTTAERPAARNAAFANLKAICNRLISAGATPVLCTVLPVTTLQNDFVNVTANIMALNDMLRAYAKANKNIILADTFKAMVDPTQTDNSAPAAWMDGDEVHPNGIGGFRIGRVVADAIRNFAPNPTPLVASNGDVGTTGANRMPGPLFISSGGKLNGSTSTDVAAGLAVTKSGTAAVTPSLVDMTYAADGVMSGKKQVLAITSAADGDTATISKDSTITLPAFAAGDVAFTDYVVEFSNMVNVKYMLIDFPVTVNGVVQHMYQFVGSNKKWPNGETFKLTMRTPDFILPLPSTNAGWSMQVAFSGAGSMNIALSQLRIGAWPQVAT